MSHAHTTPGQGAAAALAALCGMLGLFVMMTPVATIGFLWVSVSKAVLAWGLIAVCFTTVVWGQHFRP